MGKRPRDDATMDLFAWEPPAITQRLPEEKVRAATLRGRVAKTVSLVLKECGMSREDVAKKMTAFLGEEMSRAMLDAYSSEAREEHTISHVRWCALLQVTTDVRMVQSDADPLGYAVVPAKFLPAIEDSMLDDKIGELQRRREIVRRAGISGGCVAGGGTTSTDPARPKS